MPRDPIRLLRTKERTEATTLALLEYPKWHVVRARGQLRAVRELGKAKDPDICVWCEAQTIYKNGSTDPMDTKERYLIDNWGELAKRYGHGYWYVGGHRDNYPQVITSKYPIENVEKIVGEEPDQVVTHGAGWARITVDEKVLNIVTLHTWPQQWAFRAEDTEASKAENGGDKYRRMEMEYICRHTIGTSPARPMNIG